ncbi:peptidoglycan-associated lipoprotein Pal [Orbus sturtevantii]|uniref:peptidoglycan-associated lipoprotein Pal n=1 Tax=Orbus sturtevantii TaxID=3074109 RepID=UPI00370D0463
MHFSKLLKSAVIILPLIAVTACTSSNPTNKDRTSSDSSSIFNSGSLTEAQQLQELQVANTVYFDFDKYNVNSEYSKVLDSHAEFLRSRPSFTIVIEGHADERGTPEYNIALGERRATAVKAYLQGRGVPASQMSIVSYGKEKPAVLGHDAKAYEKNRRAVIVY